MHSIHFAVKASRRCHYSGHQKSQFIIQCLSVIWIGISTASIFVSTHLLKPKLQPAFHFLWKQLTSNNIFFPTHISHVQTIEKKPKKEKSSLNPFLNRCALVKWHWRVYLYLWRNLSFCHLEACLTSWRNGRQLPMIKKRVVTSRGCWCAWGQSAEFCIKLLPIPLNQFPVP